MLRWVNFGRRLPSKVGHFCMLINTDNAYDKVFERFYRLEASRSSPGNGLGLSLVDAIINLHQGQIDLADNDPGLIVRVILPRTFNNFRAQVMR